MLSLYHLNHSSKHTHTHTHTQPVVRIYSVPQDAFESSDESDDSDSGDEGARSVIIEHV